MKLNLSRLQTKIEQTVAKRYEKSNPNFCSISPVEFNFGPTMSNFSVISLPWITICVKSEEELKTTNENVYKDNDLVLFYRIKVLLA